MHEFAEIMELCVTFTMHSLAASNRKAIEALESSGSTSIVKKLRMIELQKTILVVGMFSLFEASLQDGLNCKNGFAEAEKRLAAANEAALAKRFNDFYLAINVLKHGRGASYNKLISRAKSGLPFEIKMPDQAFFEEGDVSEIATLVLVDDAFVQNCAEIIIAIYRVVANQEVASQ